jgi:hypothetical protein
LAQIENTLTNNAHPVFTAFPILRIPYTSLSPSLRTLQYLYLVKEPNRSVRTERGNPKMVSNIEMRLVGPKVERAHRYWSWPACVACACFLAAAASGLSGGLSVVLTWINPQTHLGTVGTGLLVAMMGLVLVGSHFLDVAERQRRLPAKSRSLGSE